MVKVETSRNGVKLWVDQDVDMKFQNHLERFN